MSSKLKIIINSFYYSSLKRSLDVFMALFLIIILAPIGLVIWFGILITSGRPIIFKQKRSGFHNQPFWLYKFKTMHQSAEKLKKTLLTENEAPFPMFKHHDDPRFVGIGRWLSNTGLDELPQLLNILKGEMSFIGPRPLPVSEAKIIHHKYPNWRFRELVKPGIFSEWSLDAKRHSSIKHWQDLDQKTLENGGLKYELKIIQANTFKAIFWTAKTSLARFKFWCKIQRKVVDS